MVNIPGGGSVTAAVRTDDEVLEALDFEPSEACEWQSTSDPQCSEEATTLVATPCCGVSVLFCDEHVEKTRRMVLRYSDRMRCVRCRQPIDHLHYLPLAGA